MNPNEAAFATTYNQGRHQVGLTKKEYISIELLKAILSNPNNKTGIWTHKGYIDEAMLYTNTLLEQLKHEEGK